MGYEDHYEGCSVRTHAPSPINHPSAKQEEGSCEEVDLDIRSLKFGVPFWGGAYNEHYNVLGSVLGPPLLWETAISTNGSLLVLRYSQIRRQSDSPAHTFDEHNTAQCYKQL